MAKYTGKFAQQGKAKAKPKAKVNKKPAVAIIAVVLAVAAIFGGTFAWQSISQQALNEITGVVNPGGRLHDDFNEVTKPGDKVKSYNKDVYVENFTTLATDGVQVFARVRLDEYMEFGKGAGTEGEGNQAVSLVDGARFDDKSTWRTHLYNDSENPFAEYWTWDLEGGSTVYMPTFNKNKDSLEADINGTSDDGFATYVEYSVEKKKTAVAVYDADTAPEGEKEADELADRNISVEDVISGKDPLDSNWDQYVTLIEEEHTAVETLTGKVVTMQQWITADMPVGKYWVYDEDGWAYWASPIDPDTATGLLLNGITRTKTVINEDWYYGINVVAQFITADDLGQDDLSGFYDPTNRAAAPTENALRLLNKIGVDVVFEVKADPANGVTAEAALREALEYGGTIKLADNVQIEAPLMVSADTVLDLGDKTISSNGGVWDENNSNWSLLSVQGKDTTLTIESGNFAAAENDSYCVDVRNGARLVINGGTFNGNISAVYVHEGEAIINGGTFELQQKHKSDMPYRYMLNCYDENYTANTANIMICGGIFHGFDPEAPVEIGGGNYLADGYKSTSDGNSVYTVTAE